MRLVKYTQDLTRTVIEAEEGYEKAKVEAIGAGLQLTESDVELGFVDNADDGYRLSMEQETLRLVDRGRIIKWLKGMAAAGIPRPMEPVDPDLLMEPTGEDIECDQWGAESVG